MAINSAPNSEINFIGHGHSASVYRIMGDQQSIARKVFTGSKIANLIHTLFYGAPSDYSWCEAAVKAAFFRRRVLAQLVNFWFGSEVQVAAALSFGKDEQTGCWYLDTQFVAGRLAQLNTPFIASGEIEYHNLRDHIMKSLHHHLLQAGFIGTVWQAGMGQPCAYANFLWSEERAENGKNIWHWIDLESGMPAIFSHDPLKLLGYYIPQACKRRRILFDDLDIPALQEYLRANASSLGERLGEQSHAKLLEDAEALIQAHELWSQESRFSRSLSYHHGRGRITPAEFRYYRDHPVSWFMKLFPLMLREYMPRLSAYLKQSWRRLFPWLNPMIWMQYFLKLIFVRDFRIAFCEVFVHQGIAHWQKSHQMTERQGKTLEDEMKKTKAQQFLADFGVHLAFKPLQYFFRLIVIPISWNAGLITTATAGILIFFIGIFLRFSYTLFRCLEELLRRHPPPLVALLVSCLPVIGTNAFPIQMLQAAGKGGLLSQFIIYEFFSRIAGYIPIWGGRHTGCDYTINRFIHRFINLIRGRRKKLKIGTNP